MGILPKVNFPDASTISSIRNSLHFSYFYAKSHSMKHLITIIAILGFPFSLQAQDIPYNTSPDYESTSLGHIATGLVLADINGDGWKDIVAANGNDIQRQNLVVYYNNGDGTFPASPSWSSADIDYHGHCAVGDIDKDGWPDVAVSVYIGEAGFSEPGRVKVYYNTGGELESEPSFTSIEFYTFSCALGDADADGDLDLAVAASESYGGEWDYGKIFINNNGNFNASPEWESENLMGAMDVEFGDMDNNGFLDVVFIGNEYPGAIFLADNQGEIDESPDWQSAEPSTYNNSIDIGFFGEEAVPGFVATGNDQLGGDGKIRFYDFPEGIPANSTASWTSPPIDYGSGVFLADVTRDGNLDLIYGGWWQPMEIIPGTGSSFENNPAYTSSTSSVVEAIQLADLGREAVVPMLDTITGIPEGSHAIRIDAQIVENIIGVYLNDLLLNYNTVCFVPNKNWISFSFPVSPQDEIIVEYEASADPDIVITNWDGSKGNYIFYNTNISTGIAASLQHQPEMSVSPNPAQDFISIKCNHPFHQAFIINQTGKQVLEFEVEINNQIDISNLGPGIYVIKLKTTEGKTCVSKFVKM